MEGEGFALLPHSAFCTFAKSLPYMCPYQSYKFSLALLPCQDAASSPIGCRSDARSSYRKQAEKKIIIIYINAWGWVTRYSQVTRDSECHIYRKMKFFFKACEILSDLMWKCSAKKENQRSFILLFLVFIKYLFFRTMSLHMSWLLQNPWEHECNYSITTKMTTLRKYFSIPMFMKTFLKNWMPEFFYNPAVIWHFFHIRNLENNFKTRSIVFRTNKWLI